MEDKSIKEQNLLNESTGITEDFEEIQIQDLSVSKIAEDNLSTDSNFDNKLDNIDESDNTSFAIEKKRWVDFFSKVFKYISNKDRDYVYVLMYQMSKRLSVFDMADVLIDVIKFNNNKIILLGSAFAVSFFEDCDYNYSFYDKLASLFGALLSSNNDIVIAETESLLERFLCVDLFNKIEKRNDFGEERIESIKNIWRYCQ